MTEQEITALGPAFAAYLGRFRGCLGQDRTAGHFDTDCRGLVSDLPRKTVEPIALEAGTAVRTLQEFLVTARWDHAAARDTLQRHIAAVVADLPADPLGTVGVVDRANAYSFCLDFKAFQHPTLSISGVFSGSETRNPRISSELMCVSPDYRRPTHPCKVWYQGVPALVARKVNL